MPIAGDEPPFPADFQTAVILFSIPDGFPLSLRRKRADLFAPRGVFFRMPASSSGFFCLLLKCPYRKRRGFLCAPETAILFPAKGEHACSGLPETAECKTRGFVFLYAPSGYAYCSPGRRDASSERTLCVAVCREYCLGKKKRLIMSKKEVPGQI